MAKYCFKHDCHGMSYADIMEYAPYLVLFTKKLHVCKKAFFKFSGISKPSDCIFPWDFNDKVQKEVMF